MPGRGLLPASAIAVAGLTLALIPAPAGANTINVTSYADDGSGCTLREAISVSDTDNDANGCVELGPDDPDDPDRDVDLVQLPRGNYQLSNDITIALDTGVLASDITTVAPQYGLNSGATGVGQTPTVITAAANDRAFTVLDGFLGLSDLEIRGGNAAAPGGAVWATGGDTTVSILKSTLTGNSATSGGALAATNGGTLSAENITVTGNSAADGGGIYAASEGRISVNSSTISGNTATAGDGGGIYQGEQTGIATISLVGNSIVAGNADTNGGAPDCFKTGAGQDVISNGHNLIGSTAGCSDFALITSDLRNVAPALGPLAFNPVAPSNPTPTQTMALLPGSPAMDAPIGNATAACATRDQRGFARNGTCDIGAYEVQPAVPVSPAPSGTPAKKKKKCKKKKKGKGKKKSCKKKKKKK